MQLERKRKAATFLAQLAEKKTTVSSVQPVEVVSKIPGGLYFIVKYQGVYIVKYQGVYIL